MAEIYQLPENGNNNGSNIPYNFYYYEKNF